MLQVRCKSLRMIDVVEVSGMELSAMQLVSNIEDTYAGVISFSS